MNSLVNTNDTNFNMKKYYDNQTKILTKTSAIYAVKSTKNSGELMFSSSPFKNNSPRGAYVIPKQYGNRPHQGRTSAIYPPNSLYC